MAKRLVAMGQTKYEGTVNSAGRWTGVLRLDEAALLAPLRRKAPTVYFSDLFHESMPTEWIDQVFAVMALCPWHAFQVLTKRAGRMRDYMDAEGVAARIADASIALGEPSSLMKVYAMGPLLRDGQPEFGYRRFIHPWPLPNVWLGTSVENQAAADARIPDLLATPAAVRFLSCEPLLGPVDLESLPPRELHWVICGGESGPGARPMHPDWARGLRDQCQRAGVAFFFKQWGGVNKKAAGRLLDGREWNEVPGERLNAEAQRS